MPKVLLLADDLSNGGAERQLALLASNLPPEWERLVWSLHGGPFAEEITRCGVQVDICPRRWRWDISPSWNLWRLVQEWQPDLIHSWGWMSSVAASPISKLLRIPFVNGIIRFGMYYPPRAAAIRLSMFWADRIIANSQAGLTAWKINPKKGRVVYNGFDPGRFSLFGEKKHCSDLPMVVVMTGSMAKRKDYPAFLKVARQLYINGENNWRFMAIGNGPFRAELMAYASDLINVGQVEFPEPGLEILPMVDQAHIGVLMSHANYHAEGCSNSIMEYMACGLPVICNDTGGNRELVLDGETGYLIPAGDTDALLDRLLYLRNNPQVAERLGKAGKQRILTHFSLEKMVQSTLQVYEEVLYD